MSSQALTVPQLLRLVESPQREVCLEIYRDNETLFKTASGSSSNHQTWPGGYYDHVAEAMNVACELYECLSALRPLDFSLSEALVVMYLHDIEKPWRYEYDVDTGKLVTIPGMQDKSARAKNRNETIARYGLRLNARQLNAMRYVEGELDDYTPHKRMMWPLAAFCHLCDITSARLWPNHPLPSDDPWIGAIRVADSEEREIVICTNCGLAVDTDTEDSGFCRNTDCVARLRPTPELDD